MTPPADRRPAATSGAPGLGTPVPVLRIFDEALARDFYVRWLGFAVEWEHRFEPGMPLYVRIRRDGTVLDLTEHHGDGTPGSVVWIPVRDVVALRDELHERGHPRARPGVERDAPGGPTMSIADPFGNVLRLCQPGG
jgi:catechol 2,3-dioxygenase-like lactoylglutathione lyase family enzyme